MVVSKRPTRQDYENNPVYIPIRDDQTNATVYVKQYPSQNDKFPVKWNVTFFVANKKYHDEVRTFSNYNDLIERIKTFFKYAKAKSKARTIAAFNRLVSKTSKDKTADLEIIKKSPKHAFRYACFHMNKRWPEAEPYIMAELVTARAYTKHILRGEAYAVSLGKLQ